jgi:ribosomal-protein-alanine N-acetyltransferase
MKQAIMDDKSSLPFDPSNISNLRTDTIRIRPMTVADVERVHLIDQLSFSMPWPLRSYQYELTENKASLTHVAEIALANETTIIVGMVVTWLIVDEAHIATIAVHPNYRSMGIGKKLLSATLEEAIQHGAKMATLEVREGNLAATQLYTDYGFLVTGRRPRYYHDTQEDAIIMTAKGLGDEYLAWLRSPNTRQPPVMEENDEH